MNLTNDQILILGCTIINTIYVVSWFIFSYYSSKKRKHCVECKRDFSKSVICSKCKYYKYSLSYFATKHPEEIYKIGIQDNFKRK